MEMKDCVRDPPQIPGENVKLGRLELVRRLNLERARQRRAQVHHKGVERKRRHDEIE